MGRLDGKVAIITGGARGIGGATAKRFVEQGAHVVITDVLEDVGSALAAELGDQARFVRHDVTDEEAWTAVVDSTVADHGKIDVLVNNAGILLFSSLEETTKEQFENLINVNLMGTFLGIRQVGPHMREAGQGSIVNISSADGLDGANAVGAYCASKWAVRGLTKAAAMEYGWSGVRVNSVHPGGVNTPMVNPSGAPHEALAPGFKTFPAQRACTAEEVADCILFLASDESTYCMGTELAVDGGMTAGHYYFHLPGAPSQ